MPQKHRAAVLAARRAVLENFTQVIERGIKMGHLRVVDARLAALSLIGDRRKLKDANVHESLRALREDVSFLERALVNHRG